jgi:phage-related protein
LTKGAKNSTIEIVKRVIWDKAALEMVRSFSVEVRQEVGALLRLLQEGERLGMPQSRSIKQVGARLLNYE